jgi:hypothetical protein
MSVNLNAYSKIKDKVLVGHFGHSYEFLHQLLEVRPLIENHLIGIRIYIGCKDEYAFILEGHECVVKMSELNDRKHEFGKIHEILCDGTTHGIEKLMTESAIPYKPVPSAHRPTSKRCLIAPKGNYPTKDLTEAQVNAAISLARQEGYSVEFGDELEGIGWVIGVENSQTWLGGKYGRRVSLVPTGVGTDFYITSWDNISVLQI